MNFNFDLFMDIIWISAICGLISTLCLQKIKRIFYNDYYIFFSLFIDFIIGISISLLFTTLSFKISVIVGITSWLWSESFYLFFKSKRIITNEFLYYEEDDKK